MNFNVPIDNRYRRRLFTGRMVEMTPDDKMVYSADEDGYLIRHSAPNRRQRKRLRNLYERGVDPRTWDTGATGKIRKGPRGRVPSCR